MRGGDHGDRLKRTDNGVFVKSIVLFLVIPIILVADDPKPTPEQQWMAEKAALMNQIEQMKREYQLEMAMCSGALQGARNSIKQQSATQPGTGAAVQPGSRQQPQSKTPSPVPSSQTPEPKSAP